MTTEDAARVVVIVEAEFEGSVIALARNHQTWLVESPKNRLEAEKARRSGSLGVGSVSVYKSNNPNDPYTNFISVLPLVEMHHGEFASESPYQQLSVLGLSWSDDYRAVLDQYDLVLREAVTDGFTAIRLSNRVPPASQK